MVPLISTNGGAVRDVPMATANEEASMTFPLPRMVLGVLYRMCTFVGRMKG